MTKEDLILQKLEKIESDIEPIVRASKQVNELKNDLMPLSNHAMALMIEELQGVEAGFQLEDFLSLMKEAMRNTRNFMFALKQMASIIEFIKDLEPLLKSAVPQMIQYMDKLEHQGVFRILKATLDTRAKIAAAYSPEDIEQMADAFVALLGLAKKFSDPNSIVFLEKLAAIPSNVDLSNAKKVGPLGLVSAGFSGEIKQGLGVLLELTKAMGRLKDNGDHLQQKK
jgi:uncharacterized protein YjgD (DUF1641 family)